MHGERHDVRFRRCADWIRRGTAAFFSPHGTWHGYTLRVGVIWFGGLQFTQAFVSSLYDDMPLSAARVLCLATSAAIVGSLAGVFQYGLTNIALARRAMSPKEPQ